MTGLLGSAAEFWALPGSALPLLTLLAAALALDDTAVGQTWLSQPLPAGILAGLACGDVAAGLSIGLPLQLVTLGNLPVGQAFVSEPVSAVLAGVATLAGAGRTVAAVGGLPPAALAGWLVIGVALASLVGHGAVVAERRLHLLWMLSGHRSLRDGDGRRIERLHGRCLLFTAMRGVVLTGLWLVFLQGCWLPAAARLPASLAAVLEPIPWLAGGLGVGILVERYSLRAGGGWIGVGLAAGVAVALLIG
jgi:mannose/fructose/N-acetylgalactosamine-specific phosphotransferase system component IIC